jgi:hypothetical protein
MIEITGEYMSLKVDDKIIVTARFSRHAAGDGHGAWVASTYLARLFTRDQAITAPRVAELGKRVPGQSSALRHAPRGAGMTDQLIGSQPRRPSWHSPGVAVLIAYRHAYEIYG